MRNQKVINKKSVLIVEDDCSVLATLKIYLGGFGFLVYSCESYQEAVVWLDKNNKPDVVILDVQLPDGSGLDLVNKLKSLGDIPFLVLTAHHSKDMIEKVNLSGAMNYLIKPVDAEQLNAHIEIAISRSKEFKTLSATNNFLRIAVERDNMVSVATGIVMTHHRISYELASQFVKRLARDSNRKIIEIANDIIDAEEKLNQVSPIR